MGGQGHRRPPLCAGSWTPCDLPLDVLLHPQFARDIVGGDAREEIWSPVNYSFFISSSLPTLVRSFCGSKYRVIKRLEKCAWAGDE